MHWLLWLLALMRPSLSQDDDQLVYTSSGTVRLKLTEKTFHKSILDNAHILVEFCMPKCGELSLICGY